MPNTQQFDPSAGYAPAAAPSTTFDPGAAYAPAPAPKSTIGQVMDSAGDFLSGLWKQINPVSGLKGAAQLVDHPIDTYMSDAAQRQAIYKQAEDAFKGGDYAGGSARLLHAFLPFMGPQMNQAADDFEAGRYAKAAGSSVGMGLNVAGPAAVGEGITATVPSSIRDFLASKAKSFYQSALKPSLRAGAPNPEALAQTGLENQIPVSAAGAEKISGLIDNLNDSIKNTIASDPTKTVNAFGIADRLKQTAAKFQNQVNPTADLNAIRESGADFLQNNPTDIPVQDAQALKTGTYQQLSSRAYGELGSATIEAQKALARGLKEELVTQFPEIAGLNAKESQLIDLDGALDTAVRRIGNHQLFGIGTPLAAAGAKAVSGSSGMAAVTGLAKAVFDNPVIKSKLAIALNQASKGTITIPMAGARIQGYLGGVGNQVEQETSRSLQPALAQ